MKRKSKWAGAGGLGLIATGLLVLSLAAGTAMAAPTCPNNSVINGRGSSLQRVAQVEVWNPKYNAACANAPTVSYESTSSSSGLHAFGFIGGVLNHAFQYIGTDDAPSAAQISVVEGAVSHKTKPVIVPVSQTAIAVVTHPPT